MARTNTRSNFTFVKDRAFRENLDRAFDYILELIPLAESARYDAIIKSSFRKTIIIYTASIVEALLLYILKQHKTEEECMQIRKQFLVLKEIYVIEDSKRIVFGEDVVEKNSPRFDKMNLDQINKCCKEYGLITKSLSGQVDRVRVLRNRQHLGGLTGVEHGYTKKDLEFVFSVAREVKKTANS